MSRAPLLARVLDAPGATLDRVCRSATPFGAWAEESSRLAAVVGESSRANAYLSLEPGLRLFEQRSGACLTFAMSRRHAFAVGGLHGPKEDMPELLRTFRSAATEAGVRRCLLFPVADGELRAVHGGGFRTIPVGAEAVVVPRVFAATTGRAGRAFADLRQMLNRARKRYHLTAVELTPHEAAAVGRATVGRWLAGRPLHTRMRLLVGTPCFDAPHARRYFACLSPGRDGAVALITVTPGFGGLGGGLDVMARAPDAPAGAMELVVSHAIEAAAASGWETFSLGACPMYLPGDHRPRGLRQRALLRAFDAIYRSRLLNRLFHFQNLVRFKRKFAPEWRTVHLGASPSVGVGALYAGCRMWGLFGSDPIVGDARVAP